MDSPANGIASESLKVVQPFLRESGYGIEVIDGNRYEGNFEVCSFLFFSLSCLAAVSSCVEPKDEIVVVSSSTRRFCRWDDIDGDRFE